MPGEQWKVFHVQTKELETKLNELTVQGWTIFKILYISGAQVDIIVFRTKK